MNKKWTLLGVSISIFILSVALLIQYPNDIPNGEKLFYKIGISPWSNGTEGFNYVGILIFLLIIINIVALTRFFNHRYTGRIIIAVILLTATLPHFLTVQYQTFFADGIYALDYNPKNSSYHYETDESNLVKGECYLEFKNYSDEKITFYVSLRTNQRSFDTYLVDLKAVDHYQLTIGPKETKGFNIPFTANATSYTGERISQSTGHGGLAVLISDGRNQREL